MASKSTELISGRTDASKVFANPDGSKTTQVFSEPVNMPDGKGGWQTIDPSVAVSAGRLRTKATPTPIDIAQSGDDAVLAHVVADGSHAVGFGLRGTSAVAASTSGTDVTFAGILGNLDLRVTTRPRGVKDTLVLRSSAAPAVYTFPLDLTEVTASMGATGDVIFSDSQGHEVARSPRGFMQDSKRDAHADETAMSYNVDTQLVPDGAGVALQVTLDRAWLDDPARVYPVTVDPPLSLATDWQDDTYVMTNGECQELCVRDVVSDMVR